MAQTSQQNQSQRSLELRKFFAPFDILSSRPDSPLRGFNKNIGDDTAFGAFAENAAWRLGVSRVMCSLIDRDTQYFLAGAEKHGDSIERNGLWFGSSTAGSLDELAKDTLAIQGEDDGQCLVVPNLTQDKRFSSLPYVNGSIAAYRFYAGTPIATSRGATIGIFWVLDETARPHGLSFSQRQFLCHSALSVMKHLEMQREGAERRRTALMSKGIARLLEKKKQRSDRVGQEFSAVQGHPFVQHENVDSKNVCRPKNSEEAFSERRSTDNTSPKNTSAPNSLDPVKDTFDRAARILLESLEIDSGGVVFLDTAVTFDQAGFTDAYSDSMTDIGAHMHVDGIPDQSPRPKIRHGKSSGAPSTRSSNHEHYEGQVRGSGASTENARLISWSVAPDAASFSASLDCKTLQTLLNVYPEGNVWYFDDAGFFSSLEQVEHVQAALKVKASSSQRIEHERNLSEEQAEAALLAEKFPGARQIIFLPLWDAAAKRWHAGCIVWSQSAVPVFTVSSEIAYLAAFTNSIMVEVSRLDATRADQSKADFISSISHEFRSPLHGILASSDLLQELTSDESQLELLSTVQDCGHTLLDTINHILDFSKVNSFDKAGSNANEGTPGRLPNELHSTTNVAVLCEDIVDVMVAASSYTDISKPKDRVVSSAGSFTSDAADKNQRSVKVIFDFENRDWNFFTQPGALRRILMNVIGNAQKYTDQGHIEISMQIVDRQRALALGVKHISAEVKAVTIMVKDTGRGISSEYLQHRLYQPFAQDDTFATGVGLGLSIVMSIVKQLGGGISVRSLLGKGTEVEICLPMAISDPTSADEDVGEADSKNMKTHHEDLMSLRKVASGKVVAYYRPSQSTLENADQQSLLFDSLDRILSTWYGFQTVCFADLSRCPEADVIIASQESWMKGFPTLPTTRSKIRVALITGASLTNQKDLRHSFPFYEFVSQPLGPYKLARHLLSLLQQELPPDYTGISNESINTELKRLASLTRSRPASGVADSTSSLSHEVNGALAQHLQAIGHHKTENHALMQPPPDLASVSSDHRKPSLSKQGESASIRAPTVAKQDKLHLLAVDDNEINLQLLKRFLAKRKDDTVDSAHDGFEAVAAVENSSQPYDVTFMDISMPGMDGFEATRRIRQFEVKNAKAGKEFKKTYIVALTGLGSSRDREEAVKCGFDDYLTKPIPFKKVAALLKQKEAQKAG